MGISVKDWPLVLEAGGDEDEAIAGLLHDTLEDQVATFDEIAEEFGERVAGIVRECSDSEEDPKPSWKERKTAYLEALPHHSRSAILVSNVSGVPLTTTTSKLWARGLPQLAHPPFEYRRPSSML